MQVTRIILQLLFIAELVNGAPIKFQTFNASQFWINFFVGFLFVIIFFASAVLCTYQLIEGKGIWGWCCGKTMYDSDADE